MPELYPVPSLWEALGCEVKAKDLRTGCFPHAERLTMNPGGASQQQALEPFWNSDPSKPSPAAPRNLHNPSRMELPGFPKQRSAEPSTPSNLSRPPRNPLSDGASFWANPKAFSGWGKHTSPFLFFSPRRRARLEVRMGEDALVEMPFTVTVNSAVHASA